MTCEAVSTATQTLVKSGVVSPHSLVGCTAEEIRQIESSLCVSLPECYRRFLFQMGRSAGGFLQGYDFSYPKMLDFRNWTAELIRECGSPFVLPENAFVYFFDSAGAFLYFICDGKNDPSIQMFIESEAEPRQVFGSFSEWLLAATEDHINIVRSIDTRDAKDQG